MNIVIFGASGRTGLHLVRQALDEGHHVTAFVRKPEKLAITHPRLRLATGNVSDYLKTEEAIRGNNVVLSALGANHPFKFDKVVVDGMNNIIKAMKSAGVRRLIYLSALAVKTSRKDAGFMMRYIAPILLRTELAGHDAREAMIRNSNLDWTIVQAPLLTNGPAQRRYRSGEHLQTRSFIIKMSRADVADFMVKQIADESNVRKATRLM